jgi:hypothetical protein
MNGEIQVKGRDFQIRNRKIQVIYWETSGTFRSEIEKCRSLTGHSGQVQGNSAQGQGHSPVEYLARHGMYHTSGVYSIFGCD